MISCNKFNKVCWSLSLSCFAFAVTTPSSNAAEAPSPPFNLVRDMAGTWDVKEWTWTGPGAKATHLPNAVARRRPIGDAFVEEIMSAPVETVGAFSRVSLFGYNAVNRQYEYVSLDTRAPQVMIERNLVTSSSSSELNLLGGTFVAPQWGAAKNTTFRYRLVVKRIQQNRQEVDLYLTPAHAMGQREFLGFKYLYSRRS